jgi:hypothetical protein
MLCRLIPLFGELRCIELMSVMNHPKVTVMSSDQVGLLVVGWTGGSACRLACFRTRSAHPTAGLRSQRRPVPVRTLAHASRLMRRLRSSGDMASASVSQCWTIPGCLARVRNVVDDVRSHSSLQRHSLEPACRERQRCSSRAQRKAVSMDRLIGADRAGYLFAISGCTVKWSL